MRQELIEKAIAMLEPIASKCNTTDTEYLLVLKRALSDDHFIEDIDGSYCFECVKKEKIKYRNENREELKKKKLLVDYEGYDTGSSESEGFKCCDECGIMFETCLYLDEQELEHWENQDEFGIKEDTGTAYELIKILEHNDYTERVDKLAEKVLKELNADKIVNSFDVELKDLLSPDIYNHAPLKYGVERMFILAEWFKQLMFKGYSYHIFSLAGNEWKKQLANIFQDALVREYGNNLNGIAETVKWNDIIRLRKKLKLKLDRITRVELEGHTLTSWEHEVNEDAVTKLLTIYNGRRLKINPQGEGFEKRDDWDWQIGAVSISFTGYGLTIGYSYHVGDNSGWSNSFDHKAGETVVSFLERAKEWFDKNSVAPNEFK